MAEINGLLPGILESFRESINGIMSTRSMGIS